MGCVLPTLIVSILSCRERRSAESTVAVSEVADVRSAQQGCSVLCTLVCCGVDGVGCSIATPVFRTNSSSSGSSSNHSRVSSATPHSPTLHHSTIRRVCTRQRRSTAAIPTCCGHTHAIDGAGCGILTHPRRSGGERSARLCCPSTTHQPSCHLHRNATLCFARRRTHRCVSLHRHTARPLASSFSSMLPSWLCDERDGVDWRCGMLTRHSDGAIIVGVIVVIAGW